MQNVISIFIVCVLINLLWRQHEHIGGEKSRYFQNLVNPFWTYYDPELEKLIFQYCGNVFWNIELKFLKGNAHVWVRERDVSGKLEYWAEFFKAGLR